MPADTLLIQLHNKLIHVRIYYELRSFSLRECEMTETKIQTHTYMPGLDGLRALAVFAVIAYHLNLPFVPGGFLGVTLFFVLSGYLITDLLLSEWRLKGRIDFKNFFIRRGKRLLPSGCV